MGTFEFGELLYRNTFKLAPEAISLFPREVRQRYRLWHDESSGDSCGEEEDVTAIQSAALRNLFAKVVQAVGCTVAGLHDFAKLVPMLTTLGGRHMHYKVP